MSHGEHLSQGFRVHMGDTRQDLPWAEQVGAQLQARQALSWAPVGLAALLGRWPLPAQTLLQQGLSAGKLGFGPGLCLREGCHDMGGHLRETVDTE